MADQSGAVPEQIQEQAHALGGGDDRAEGHSAEHATVFFIDKEPFEAPTDDLTPRQILTEYAKEDPTQTVLVLVHGKDREKLENLDQPIEVRNGTHFTVLHQGPTPVS